MNRSKILVLGGSYMQKSFIESVSKRNDIDLTFIDGNENCYLSRIYPQYFYHLDFSDFENLLKFSKKKEFNAIISPANEYGNLIAAKLSKELDLPYNSIETVENTLFKSCTRKCLKSSDILMPKSVKINNINDYKELQFINFPLIVKPSSSSASRGVKAVYKYEELEKAINEAKKFSSDILIEELIKGKQFSLETVTSGNKHYLIAITEEIISGEPNFIERCHFITPNIYDKYFDVFQEYVNNLLTLLNVQFGACHIEIILKDNNIYLIEIGSRTGGWREKLIWDALNINYSYLVLDSYLQINTNIKLELRPKYSAMVGILLNENDFLILDETKRKNILTEYYLNGNKTKKNPLNLMDAVGYFYLRTKDSDNNIYKYKL